jgi:hypothetical protein
VLHGRQEGRAGEGDERLPGHAAEGEESQRCHDHRLAPSPGRVVHRHPPSDG